MTRAPPSPWRQPLAWLVVTLPAIAVAASLFVLLPTTGLPSSRALRGEADLTAQRMHLVARVHRVGATMDVQLLGDGLDRATQLELVLRHPLRAADDRRVALAPTSTGWHGRLDAVDSAHDWILELAPADGRWRLLGHWPANAPEVALRPAATTQ